MSSGRVNQFGEPLEDPYETARGQGARLAYENYKANQDKIKAAEIKNANLLLNSAGETRRALSSMETKGILPEEAGVGINYLGSNVISTVPVRLLVALIGLILALLLFYFAGFAGFYNSYNTLKKSEVAQVVNLNQDKYGLKNFYDELEDYYSTSIAGAVVVGFTCLVLVGLIIVYSQRRYINEEYDVLEKMIVQLEAERAYKKARRPIKTASSYLSRRFLNDNVQRSLSLANDSMNIANGILPRPYGVDAEGNPETYSILADKGRNFAQERIDQQAAEAKRSELESQLEAYQDQEKIREQQQLEEAQKAQQLEQLEAERIAGRQEVLGLTTPKEQQILAQRQEQLERQQLLEEERRRLRKNE